MAFRIAVSGLRAATADLDVTGNNIANASTTGFKSSRTQFADVYAASNLGTSKDAVGQGVQLSAVAQQFTQGNVSFTDNSLDLAINGEGFFVLEDAEGRSYSRAGAFGLDKDGFVVNSTGQNLVGFQAVSGAITGATSPLQIDNANLAPQATNQVDMGVNLDAGDNIPKLPGSSSVGIGSFSNFSQVDGVTFQLRDGVNPPETVTLDFLTDGIDPATATQNQIAAYIASKIDVTTGYAAVVSGTNVTVTATDNGSTGLTFQAGLGDPGNDASFAITSLGSGMGAPTPDGTFTFDNADNVSSAFINLAVFNPSDATTFNNSSSLTVFDSLGQEHLATVFFKKIASNTWETHLRIDNDNAQTTTPQVVSFDTAGNLTTVQPVPSYGSFTPTTGAAPFNLALDFTGTTQFGAPFGVDALTQDGFTTGRLASIDIDEQGVVLARFTNGETQAQGQVVLANFNNPQGLQPLGDTLWAETNDSGTALLGGPGTATLGLVQSGAVEESNVELAAELVNMIIAQRNFQANAQVIRTEDDVTQTIINIR